MVQADFSKFASLYRDGLLNDTIPFWLKHSIDTQYGGYFTCLDRKGEVYDTDKFVWLQARQVWLFSMLYNRLEKKSQWLDTAKIGYDFLVKHGMDETGNWYFSLDRQGTPLVAPYNIFSDCFAAMALSQYALASGDQKAKQIAQATYNNILKRKSNPKGKWTKAVPGSRPMVSLAVPMILANLSLELEWLLPKEQLEAAIDMCIHEVMYIFFDPKVGLLFENVAPDGSHIDSFEGRLINPGHGIEAMWFLMDIAARGNNGPLIEKCIFLMHNILNFGWDEKYGGIFYFMDAHGHPTQQLEWDQKLWWVHLESLVALAMGYRMTRNERCWQWYEKVHDYAWNHFPDPQYGEWYGYLNRQGQPFLDLKGGKWKGCFHLPRAQFLCWREFDKLAATQKA